ncbi:MAG: TraR/DksA C4-type zinc finger protein [bacterium]
MFNRQYYRVQLLQEKERLVKQIRSLEKGLKESQGDSIKELSVYDNHPADIGSETFERGKDLGLRDNSRLLLAKVEEALQKLDEGTYGSCENCGQLIPAERLAAVPYTTLCHQCKDTEEKRLRHSTQRPLEEETMNAPFSRTFHDQGETVGVDGEDSWQAVARFNKLSNVFYEDVGEDEDKLGLVEETDNISNEDYKEQL